MKHVFVSAWHTQDLLQEVRVPRFPACGATLAQIEQRSLHINRYAHATYTSVSVRTVEATALPRDTRKLRPPSRVPMVYDGGAYLLHVRHVKDPSCSSLYLPDTRVRKAAALAWLLAPRLKDPYAKVQP